MLYINSFFKVVWNDSIHALSYNFPFRLHDSWAPYSLHFFLVSLLVYWLPLSVCTMAPIQMLFRNPFFKYHCHVPDLLPFFLTPVILHMLDLSLFLFLFFWCLFPSYYTLCTSPYSHDNSFKLFSFPCNFSIVCLNTLS